MEQWAVRMAQEFVKYPTEKMGYTPGGVAIEPSTNKDLPEGCTPVEYLERKPTELFAVEFAGKELNRVQQILSLYGLGNDVVVPTRTSVRMDACKMILPKHIVEQLPSQESARAVPFVAPIQISCEPPILYRFIKQQHIDEFFEKGILRISSFNRCRKAENVHERADKDEGKASFIAIGNNQTVEMVIGAGGNPLMLCTSLSEHAKHKRGDGCIAIQDFPAFIITITDALRMAGINVRHVMHGPCTYSERRIVKRFVGEQPTMKTLMTQISSEGNSFDFDLIFQLAGEVGGKRHYFTKPPRFGNEHEYRIVWDCENTPKDGFVDIRLADPERYCSRHDPESVVCTAK